jgi:hypothetical protein
MGPIGAFQTPAEMPVPRGLAGRPAKKKRGVVPRFQMA